MKIPLNISFVAGTTKKTIYELLHVQKNSVYRLESSEKDKILIQVEDKTIGKGKLRSLNGNLYIEVTDLSSGKVANDVSSIQQNKSTNR